MAPAVDPDSSEVSDDYLLVSVESHVVVFHSLKMFLSFPKVSTSNTTIATVKLKDPTNFLENATLSYYWFVNDTSYGQTVVPSFSYKFKEKGFSNVCGNIFQLNLPFLIDIFVFKKLQLEVTVVANFHNNKTHARSKTSRNDLPGEDDLPPSKKAVFRTSLKAADPTKKLSVAGETWIQHGDMVDLTVTCDGTGPWYSCWDHVAPDYNVTGNETCRPDEVILMEDSCQFSVLWYFSKPDSYGFLVRGSNGLSGTAEVVTVNVYEVHKQTSLSFVLAPVLSSVAIIIIAAAAYLFYRHYSANTSIETADFDFTLHDEDDPDLEVR